MRPHSFHMLISDENLAGKSCFQIANPITENWLLDPHFRTSGIAQSVQLCSICSGDFLNLLSPAPSSPVK